MYNKRVLKSPGIAQVKLTGEYWPRIQAMFRDQVLEKQWRILNGEVEIENVGRSHCVDNFRIMAGDMTEKFPGSYWFSDHELGKWMEAAAYGLALGAGENIREHMEYTIDLLARAQAEDGYLNTYYTLYEPGKRFTNFTTGHELLNAGNFLEAGIAYYLTGGGCRLLDITIRYIDLIYDMVMSADHPIYDGHEEIEIALIKLYLLCGEEKYLNLARRFVDTRGVGRCLFLDEDSVRLPNVGMEYYQAHLPVREQKDALGHAVRATYLYTAMAELVAVAKDETLLQPVRTLWEDIIERKIYITGGIGSEHHGERFTSAYDLPNDSSYSETCAGIGLMMFARALLKLQPEAAVADQMEKVLYNTVLAGISVDGEHYFYVNPLSMKPTTAVYRQDLWQVRTKREEWMLCPCCPPNLVRLILSLNDYLYVVDEDSIYLNLLISNELELERGGKKQKLLVEGSEPWGGTLRVTAESDITGAVYIKKPYWSGKTVVRLNGEVCSYKCEDGYILLKDLRSGDSVEIDFDMQARMVYANPHVDADCGKIAVEKGYLVYCTEQVDNGEDVFAITVETDQAPEVYTSSEDKLGGELHRIRLKGQKTRPIKSLYTFERPQTDPVTVELIPYYLWNNRGEGEMTVWLNAR